MSLRAEDDKSPSSIIVTFSSSFVKKQTNFLIIFFSLSKNKTKYCGAHGWKDENHEMGEVGEVFNTRTYLYIYIYILRSLSLDLN